MTDQPAHPQTGTRDKVLRLIVLGISAVVGITALWGVLDAVRGDSRIWGLLGFELVTIVTAGLGIFVGLGKPREAPALSIACLGATIFAAATLGRFSAIVTRAETAISEGQAVRLLIRDAMFQGRLLAAVILLTVATCFALGRDWAAWRKLILGSLLLVPVLGVLVWLVGPGIDWLMAPVESTGGLVRVVGAFIGGLGLIIAASVSIHLVIRAFEDRLPPLGAGATGGTTGGGSGGVSGSTAGRNPSKANPTKPA